MAEKVKKLLLVIPVRLEKDLMSVVESEGWHTLQDLYKKTATSYNMHWNGNYVLDQDEIPWKASLEEINSLEMTKGRVVVLDDGCILSCQRFLDVILVSNTVPGFIGVPPSYDNS